MGQPIQQGRGHFGISNGARTRETGDVRATLLCASGIKKMGNLNDRSVRMTRSFPSCGGKTWRTRSKKRGGKVDALPEVAHPTVVSDELSRIYNLLRDAFPDVHHISFEFDDKLSVHMDSRQKVQVALIQERLPYLAGGRLFPEYAEVRRPSAPSITGSAPWSRDRHNLSDPSILRSSRSATIIALGIDPALLAGPQRPGRPAPVLAGILIPRRVNTIGGPSSPR